MPIFQRNNRRASKLSVPEVEEIRYLYQQGKLTQGDLSRRFGVSVVQIGRIVRGEVWQQLPVLSPLMSEGELKESATRMLAMQEKLQEDAVARLHELVEAPKKLVDTMLDEIRSPLDE